MSIRKIWKTKDVTVDETLLQACGNDKILAILLKNRGITTKEKINDFLNPLKMRLTSPDVFVDMQKTVDRIKLAIDNNEHITVYGDFDADGVTSTALLYLTLSKIGADVDYYLPDRDTESHGLNTKALVKLISKKKTRLIITVDCGISNVQEVYFAKGFKTDVIITDHHEAPETLPDAFAILNPKAPDSLISSLSVDELESLNYLAGVGVSFKLACKLLEMYNKEDFVHEILPLATVGTIGDVVELIGENRCIVSMGLELLRHGKHKGLQKIIESIGITDKSTLTSENVAFGIVPRINAAGRLDSPNTAINVLISQNDEEIDTSVKMLNDLNLLRQNLCDETFEVAKSLYEENKQLHSKSIVLFHDDWHIGVIGIVCSKLVEEYNKPTFLMTRDSRNPHIIRCSCRSILDINLHAVLSQHKNLFEGFGGHKMAAGFSFDENKIKFEEFRKILNTTIAEFSQDVDFSKSEIDVDMVIEPEDVNIDLINTINKLQPFGSANPSPLFVVENLILNQFKMMGQNNNHLKIYASKNSCNNIECIKWNLPNFSVPLNTNFNILFYPKINEFNGNTTVQYIVSDIHSEYIKFETDSCFNVKILDHRNKKDILAQIFDYIASTKKTTGIFIENPHLKKEIFANYSQFLPYCFDRDYNDVEKEQIMFFEAPSSVDDFKNIVKKSNANIIHLMNFGVSEIEIDLLLVKLSGMLKYAVSNLN